MGQGISGSSGNPQRRSFRAARPAHPRRRQTLDQTLRISSSLASSSKTHRNRRKLPPEVTITVESRPAQLRNHGESRAAIKIQGGDRGNGDDARLKPGVPEKRLVPRDHFERDGHRDHFDFFMLPTRSLHVIAHGGRIDLVGNRLLHAEAYSALCSSAAEGRNRNRGTDTRAE